MDAHIPRRYHRRKADWARVPVMTSVPTNSHFDPLGGSTGLFRPFQHRPKEQKLEEMA